MLAKCKSLTLQFFGALDYAPSAFGYVGVFCILHRYHLSIYLSIYLFIYLFTYLSLHPLISLFIYLSTYLSIYIFISLSIDLFAYLSIQLDNYTKINTCILSSRPRTCRGSFLLTSSQGCLAVSCRCSNMCAPHSRILQSARHANAFSARSRGKLSG